MLHKQTWLATVEFQFDIQHKFPVMFAYVHRLTPMLPMMRVLVLLLVQQDINKMRTHLSKHYSIAPLVVKTPQGTFKEKHTKRTGHSYYQITNQHRHKYIHMMYLDSWRGNLLWITYLAGGLVNYDLCNF